MSARCHPLSRYYRDNCRADEMIEWAVRHVPFGSNSEVAVGSGHFRFTPTADIGYRGHWVTYQSGL